jgi:hypothetical protein
MYQARQLVARELAQRAQSVASRVEGADTRNVWAKTRPLEAGFVHNNIDTAHSSAPPRVHVGRGDILGRKPSDLFGIRLDAIVSSWPSH